MAAQSDDCPNFDLSADAELTLERIDLVLVADVEGTSGESVTLKPLAYLKGAGSGAAIVLFSGDDPCPSAEFEQHARVLVALESGADGSLEWPPPSQVFQLDPTDEFEDAPLVIEIRDVTGQFAVPADSAESGAGIDWGNAIVPVGGGLIIVFVVSLVLMVFWHRIDPS